MDWLEIARTLGVPVLCLVALAVAVWKVGVWTALNVLQPLAQKHMAFIDTVSRSVGSMTDAMTDLADARKQELTVTGSILQKLDHLTEKMEQTAKAITEVKSVIIRTESVSVVPGGRDGGK